MRKDSPVLILIESARAHDSGVQFFFSRSGAILTEENIDPVFIARAIDARSGQLVYHRQRFVIANPPSWSWFPCQCGSWLFSGFYICPDCKRHISQDVWPMGPQTEAEMPAESEEEEDIKEDALATERIRESAHAPAWAGIQRSRRNALADRRANMLSVVGNKAFLPPATKLSPWTGQLVKRVIVTTGIDTFTMLSSVGIRRNTAAMQTSSSSSSRRSLRAFRRRSARKCSSGLSSASLWRRGTRS